MGSLREDGFPLYVTMNTFTRDDETLTPDRILQVPIDPAGQFLTQYITHIVKYNLDRFGFDLEHYVPFPETALYLNRLHKFTAGLNTDYRIQDVASSIGI
jgi:hypothetical protein